MASTTWVGGNSGNETDWATGANWSTGSIPTTGAHVVIANTGHNCALDQTRTIGSLTIESGATIVGGGFTLNVTSEGDASGGTEHFAVKNEGIISAASSLNLNITTAATTSVDWAGSSGRFNDVTVNHASCIINVESTFHIDGHLTITLGKVVCGGNTVEITGRTDIGPASGVADQATLQCDNSAMFLGSGRTSSFALIVNQGGTFTGGTGNHTIGSIETKNNSNAKCTLTNAVTTIDGEHAGDNYALSIEGNSTFAHNSGTVTITRASDTRIRNSGADLALNNLIINHASAVITLASNGLTCAGDLTITAGEFGTGADKALTVAGNTVVTGTLTGNNSTLIFGTDGVHGSTESGALHVESSGSLVFGSGDLTVFSGFTAKGTNTVTSTGGGDILVKGRTTNGFMNSHGHTGVNITGDYKILFDDNALHDIRNNMAITAANIEYSLANRTYDFWTTSIPPSGSLVTFTGNLNISNASTTLDTLSSGRQPTQTFTVTGDTTLTGSLIGNTTEISLGSLTIASGGTYSATSGTTTITDESSGGYALENQGTFTHNFGKVLIDFDTPNKNDNTEIKCNEFYDFEIKMNGASYSTMFRDLSGDTVTFLGDLTITKGKFDDNVNSDTYIIHGSTILESEGSFGSATNWHTGNITHHGLVVLKGNYYRSNAGGTVKMGGIRNLGGSVL